MIVTPFLIKAPGFHQVLFKKIAKADQVCWTNNMKEKEPMTTPLKTQGDNLTP
jgi:hypothetical protein